MALHALVGSGVYVVEQAAKHALIGSGVFHIDATAAAAAATAKRLLLLKVGT